MSVSNSNTETVSDNTVSPWVPLSPGPNKVSVTSPSWDGTKAAALWGSDDDSELTKRTLKIDAVAVSTIINDEWTVDGPGYVRIAVSAYDTQPVTLLVKSSTSR